MSDINTSKVDGNTVSASEFNQLAEINNLISTSGQTPSTTNTQQISIGSARYSSAGQFYTDGGTVNAYVLSPVSPFKSPVSATSGEGYFVGMTIRFRAGNANTGASTVNVNGAGVKNLKKADGTDLTTGDILTNNDVMFRYNGTNFVKVENINPATTTTQGISYLNNPITIAFNGSTAMDIGAGVINYDDGSNQLKCSAITGKIIQASGSWTAGSSGNGLDTGARANSTWYNIFEIIKNSDGTNDILYSTSRTSPTVPSGYTLVAWIGRVRTDGSGNIDQNYLAKRTNYGQEVFFKTSAAASGTTVIPWDDTIPQNTEGTEFLSLPIIPLNSKSRLIIDVQAVISTENASGTIAFGALFQDSIANAIASCWSYVSSGPIGNPLKIRHFMENSTTNETTFKFRAGPETSTTTTLNGRSGTRRLGGTANSYISIQEII